MLWGPAPLAAAGRKDSKVPDQASRRVRKLGRPKSFLTVAMMEVPSYSVVGSLGPEVSRALPMTVPFSTHGEINRTGRRAPSRSKLKSLSDSRQERWSSGGGADPVPGGLT